MTMMRKTNLTIVWESHRKRLVFVGLETNVLCLRCLQLLKVREFRVPTALWTPTTLTRTWLQIRASATLERRLSRLVSEMWVSVVYGGQGLPLIYRLIRCGLGAESELVKGCLNPWQKSGHNYLNSGFSLNVNNLVFNARSNPNILPFDRML